MADLPMAQLPNFQTQASPIPYQNPGQALAAGFSKGTELQQNQQAINQEQQKIQMAKQQQTIAQVDTLLKNGMNYPGMLPTFWPAIATRMNSLSPDYQLDQNK